jgi:integrase
VSVLWLGRFWQAASGPARVFLDLGAQGASVKAVQAQLGHATASITLDTYGHLFPSEMEALADRLEHARAAALANRVRTPRGPAVVTLREHAGS